MSEMLRPDGRSAVMGYQPKPMPVPVGSIIMGRYKILGSQQNGVECLYEALDMVAQGKGKMA
ncbi:MAG: hypothetical protein WCF16_09105 [Alphaproteobacteria bacterium]